MKGNRESMGDIFNNWETAEIDNKLRYHRNQKDI